MNSTETQAGRPLLEVRGLKRHFPTAGPLFGPARSVKAVDGVDLVVGRQEVHGLLGQNGSGKSTLIKVLAGFHEPDPGATLRIGGHEVALPLKPGDFRRLGIAFVHQHLGLVPSM
ncbi:ATP-binding cassette domain-containing protein, partial [Rhizobiaceae sp. 2RAB30]